MPSEWKQQCPGFAVYRWTDDGGIEVQDRGFPHWDPLSKSGLLIAAFWDKYQDLLIKHAQAIGVPIAWAVGIIAIESGGDPWACSPCDAAKGCSLAPGCGGGVASDGKTYSCCAYGMMQIIDSAARDYGMKNGAELLGNPDDSIRIGLAIFRQKLNGGAQGDPIVAARMYNGCKGCGGGYASCNGGGMFGVGGQGNYAEKFAMAANTFLAAGLLPKSKPKSKLWGATKALALMGAGALLVAGIWDTQRVR